MGEGGGGACDVTKGRCTVRCNRVCVCVCPCFYTLPLRLFSLRYQCHKCQETHRHTVRLSLLSPNRTVRGNKQSPHIPDCCSTTITVWKLCLESQTTILLPLTLLPPPPPISLPNTKGGRFHIDSWLAVFIPLV